MKSITIIASICFSLPVYAQIADSTQRSVKLDSAVNFRDLGGYKNNQGKTVKWGKVYRSADISLLSNADVIKLQGLNITTVVDLREDSEQKKAPDKLPAGARYVDCSVAEMDLGMASWMANLKGKESADSLFLSFMQKTDHLPQKFGPLFQALLNANDEEALMFHCSAGKDRTGIASALFLHALGVPYATIEADYLASNVYRLGDNERMIKMMISMGLHEQVAKDMIFVKPMYLKATFDAIELKYGTVDKFLDEAMGIGKKQRKILRRKYLS